MNTILEKELVKSKSPQFKDNRFLNPFLCSFDFPTLIGKMKHKLKWENGDMSVKILLRSPNKKIVLTVLREGTLIDSFQSNGSVIFQIIEGKLRFCTRKVSVIIEKGELLTLNENVKYSLKTEEETVLLLTIANSIFHPGKN
jgi:quercetin dioxygenase-like cupin family protein